MSQKRIVFLTSVLVLIMGLAFVVAVTAQETVDGHNPEDLTIIDSNPVLAIPDDGYNGTPGSMACDIIDASAIPGDHTVDDVHINLGVDHTWIGDLTVKLFSPDGSVLGLVSRPGLAETIDDGSGCCGDSSIMSSAAIIEFGDSLGDDAETMGDTISNVQVVCQDDGRCGYFPNPDSVVGLGNFADFASETASGDWTLCVGDSAVLDTGTFLTWTLALNHSGPPNINVNPLAVDSTQPPDTQVTLPLDISNTGGSDLDWFITEDDLTIPRLPFAPGASPPANRVTIGDDDKSLSTSGFSGSVVTPKLETPEGLTTITHSANQSIVPGNSVSCPAGADIPWLSAAPVSGTTAPGNMDTVDVTFDSTGLTIGIYTGTLCIDSNDPADPVIEVTLEMTVAVDMNYTFLPYLTYGS